METKILFSAVGVVVLLFSVLGLKLYWQHQEIIAAIASGAQVAICVNQQP